MRHLAASHFHGVEAVLTLQSLDALLTGEAQRVPVLQVHNWEQLGGVTLAFNLGSLNV